MLQPGHALRSSEDVRQNAAPAAGERALEGAALSSVAVPFESDVRSTAQIVGHHPQHREAERVVEDQGHPQPRHKLEQIVRAANEGEQSPSGYLLSRCHIFALWEGRLMYLVGRVARSAQPGQQQVVVEVAGDAAQPHGDTDAVIRVEALAHGQSDVSRRGEAVSGHEEEHEGSE